MPPYSSFALHPDNSRGAEMHPTEIEACRCCGNPRLESILSLGVQHLTGVFPRSATEPVASGPLALVKCFGASACGLVQLRHTYDPGELYGSRYGYRSGLTNAMTRHLSNTVTEVLGRYPCELGAIVLDIGSNDGTLLSFMPEHLERVGMDPTIAKYQHFYAPDILAIPELFSAARFRESFGARRADLITSLAMFYDLPDPLSFVRDVAESLAPNGVWYLEQSYLPTMLARNAYDTICHEHLEYYTLSQLQWMMPRAGLQIIDARLNDVNGGSFSVTVCHEHARHRPDLDAIRALESIERAAALDTMAPYGLFQARVAAHRDALVGLLTDIRRHGATLLGYGASTKGNVILQYCGLTPHEIPAIAELNPDKVGAYTPGMHIPMISEAEAHARNPDYFLVMPWHFREDIIQREAEYLRRGGQMIFPLPEIDIVEA